MPKIVRPPDVYIQDTRDKRERGAFAARDFSEGEVVEVAPVMRLSTPHSAMDEELSRRAFYWSKLGGEDADDAIAFGYGSMYNHANPSNMRYAADNQRVALVFTAVRDIAKHEELTINYCALGGEHTSDQDDWFETHDVEPL